MKDLINTVYFDKIRYVLNNIPKFELSNDELIVVLAILILQEKEELVSVETLQKETGMEHKSIDDIITILAAKRYLEVKVNGANVQFDIDSIFDLKSEVIPDVSDLFKIFEDEFSRILNQRELVRLNEWKKKYTDEAIIDALRSASIMNKLDFNYINKILENNHSE